MRNRFKLAAATALVVVTFSSWEASVVQARPIDPIDPGEGGGGYVPPQEPPPFNPPPRPFLFAPDLPIVYGGFSNSFQHCNQVAHAGILLSEDVVQGTTLYAWGIAVPGSRANFGFYNPFGQLVKTHLTNPARSNCVIHYEPEPISTWDMAPGYYFVYASYWSLSTNLVSDSLDGYPLGRQGRYATVIRIR